MNKEQAIHDFWSGFGLTAYDEYSVPDNAQMPYITYGVSTGALEDVVPLHASIWYYDPSWEAITAKSRQIAQFVGQYGHKVIPLDDGRMYLVQGTPFSQRMNDPSDRLIKRIYININAEFLTAY